MRRAGLLVLFACVASCRRPASEEPERPKVAVHCAAPSPKAIDETVALRGRIAPPPGGDLPIASQIPGRVVQVAVHEGERIASGAIVATVDDVPSREAVKQAEAALAQAQAQDVNSRATLERVRTLAGRGIAAKQELDDAVAHDEATRANVVAATAAADLARRTLGRAQVRSSFAGVVTRILRGPGAIVDGTGATPIVQLASSGAVELVAEATDRELARIAVDQTARGSLLTGVAFEGVVRARASALDPATGLGAVRISIGEPAASAAIGTFGRVVVTTLHRDAVLVLPSAALRGAVSDGAEVAVCAGGKIKVKAVGVGWRDDASFEVTSGLGAADRVAVDHVLGLVDDTAIEEEK